MAEYGQVIRRRKWLFLATAVTVPVVAVLLTLNQTPTYQASVKVLLNQQNVADPQAQPTDPARAAQTQADLARALEVTSRVVADAGVAGLTSTELLKMSSVTASLGSDFLTFSVKSVDPKIASRLANTYARSFVTYRRIVDEEAIASARTVAERRKKELEAAGLGRTAQLSSVVQQIASLDALRPAALSVLHEAPGAMKVGPHAPRNGALGLVLGLILGVCFAFLGDVLDTRVRSLETIRNGLHGLPLLGKIPMPPRAIREADSLVMLAAATSDEAEPFRVLRANFDLAVSQLGAKTVMVTSGVGGEGKTTTAANLAVALARGGRRVVLIDFDLRNPYLHRLFDRRASPGLTDVALFGVDLDDALVEVAVADSGTHGRARHQAGHEGTLAILPVGRTLLDPDELRIDVVVGPIIKSLANRADCVLIDSGPLLPNGDAIVLSTSVDAILLVVRLNGLPSSALADLRRVLPSSPAAKLGFVLTGAEATAHRKSQHSGVSHRSPRSVHEPHSDRRAAEPEGALGENPQVLT